MKKAVLALILTMAVASQAFSDEIDEVRELLAKEEGGDILYLSKINFGVSGGDNWIANRSDGRTYIYTIDDDKEVKRSVDRMIFAELSKIQFWDSSIRSGVDLEYDIMQGIPGTRLGSKAANFGDYNCDGKDEIFIFAPGFEDTCFIRGYDSDKGEEEYYFQCRYDITSSKEPAPVFFANYQGRDGILVHLRNHMAERYAWFFYVWHEERRKYAQLTFIWDDDIDYSAFPVVRKKGESQNSSETRDGSVVTIVEIELPDSEEEFADDSGKNPRFIFYVAIAVGVIAFALALFFVVRRKKG